MALIIVRKVVDDLALKTSIHGPKKKSSRMTVAMKRCGDHTLIDL